jgi:hypothetical protein
VLLRLPAAAVLVLKGMLLLLLLLLLLPRIPLAGCINDTEGILILLWTPAAAST